MLNVSSKWTEPLTEYSLQDTNFGSDKTESLPIIENGDFRVTLNSVTEK